MSSVLEFLRQYWFEIAAGLGFVLELVFIFIKRKPKSIDDFMFALDEALTLVPQYVCKVERAGCGIEKKCEVMDLVVDFVEKYLSRKLTESERQLVTQAASAHIELVLNTPKKKESLDEK